MNEEDSNYVLTFTDSPDLQPIELFWAPGKNHVARNHKFGREMSEVVELLREGWYGAKAKEGENKELKKKARRVDQLFNKAIHMANTKFIKMCDGLDGTVGALEIKDNHQANYKDLPIDMLLHTIDLTVGYELDDDADNDRETNFPI
jgi:hypothetical protein